MSTERFVTNTERFVEGKIRSAVEVAKARGWRIIKNAYFDGAKGCCPLAACVLDEIVEASRTASIPERAARVLGIAPEEAVRIAAVVDGDVKWAEPQPFGDVGVRLRDLVDA